MAQVGLQRSRIQTLVRQGIAAGVPESVHAKQRHQLVAWGNLSACRPQQLLPAFRGAI
jgi:hypothetical protein